MSSFAGGLGTSNSPYQVETAAQLNAVRNEDSGTYFEQIADIDLSGYLNWEPLKSADSNVTFSSYYDGRGHIIKNITIDRPEMERVGLFRNLWSAEHALHNIILMDCNVIGGPYTGALLGSLGGSWAYRTIRSCMVINATVEGTRHVTEDEDEEGNPIFIYTNERVGGLCGRTNSMVNQGILSCGAIDCTIKSTSSYGVSGGLVGSTLESGGIRQCYSISCYVESGGQIGGLCGKVNDAEDCYSASQTGTGDNLFAGEMSGEILRCFYNTSLGSDDYADPATTSEMTYPIDPDGDVFTTGYSFSQHHWWCEPELFAGYPFRAPSYRFEITGVDTEDVVLGRITKYTEGRNVEDKRIYTETAGIRRFLTYSWFHGWFGYRPIDDGDIRADEDFTSFLVLGKSETTQITSEISTPEQLFDLRFAAVDWDVPGPYFECQLMNDIDLENFSVPEYLPDWVPEKKYGEGDFPSIGCFYELSDEGTFGLNGNNYTIKNMTIDRPEKRRVGFCEELVTNYIENVTFEDCYVRGDDLVGVVAGTYRGGASGFIEEDELCWAKNVHIKNCEVIALANRGDAGGFAGQISASWDLVLMNEISVTGKVTGGIVGGLMGWGNGFRIIDCYVRAEVTSHSDFEWSSDGAAGICGGVYVSAGQDQKLKNLYFDGELIREYETAELAPLFINWGYDDEVFESCYYNSETITAEINYKSEKEQPATTTQMTNDYDKGSKPELGESWEDYWELSESGAGIWTEGEYYALNDTVEIEGQSYTCIEPHHAYESGVFVAWDFGEQPDLPDDYNDGYPSLTDTIDGIWWLPVFEIQELSITSQLLYVPKQVLSFTTKLFRVRKQIFHIQSGIINVPKQVLAMDMQIVDSRQLLNMVTSMKQLPELLIYVKDNGSWQSVINGYIKHNNSWQRITAQFIKKNNEFKR